MHVLLQLVCIENGLVFFPDSVSRLLEALCHENEIVRHGNEDEHKDSHNGTEATAYLEEDGADAYPQVHKLMFGKFADQNE